MPDDRDKGFSDKTPLDIETRVSEARGTFTRRSLVAIIQSKWPRLSRREALNLVETIIDEIVEGIAREGNVKLHGFGAFVVREKSRRPGRNPRTGSQRM